MINEVTIENGFAEVGRGAWLMGRAQPVAFFGNAVIRHLKGLVVRDRSALLFVETTDKAKCADSAKPFLTHIPCVEKISAVSSKVLVAPAAARTGAENIKVIPLSFSRSIGVTKFSEGWVVTATAGRTNRIHVEDGETLSIRPEAVVAWTGNNPTAFVKKLSVLDILLPRGPRNMLLHFHGPCVVWSEGSRLESMKTKICARGYYGV